MTDSFRRVSLALRQPFLDFVASVGQQQGDRMGWISSSFAWKDPDASDLFLLICYLKLVKSLTGEAMTVLIEDRWLHATLTGYSPWRSKLALLARGFFSRAHWLFRIVREYVSFLPYKRRFETKEHHDVLLYSLPHPRCFDSEVGWNDPFLGELDSILAAGGHSVGRLIPADPLGYASELAPRAKYVHPLILELSVARLLSSLTALWRPNLSHVPKVSELDVSLLALREWWMDLGRSVWCQHRLFYECALRLMQKRRPASVIFPFENQPWEKMLVSAAREAGVRSIGYQHSTAPQFFLPYFLGKGEAESVPLPDVVLTTGRQQARLLIDGGTPADRTAVAGSLRYQHIHRPLERGARAGTSKKVLVVTTHDPSLTSSLLEALANAFPDRGEASGLSLFYRPHPTLPISQTALASWMTPVTGDLTSQLPHFDVVVNGGTTVGVEALFLGIPVVQYQADVLVDVDPMNALPDGSFLTASRSQLRERIEEAACRERGEVSPGVRMLMDELFPAVDEGVWLSVVAGFERPNEIRRAEGL
ncbi:MAG TPA: hypothetical protein VLV78_15940 [Thermoanaerobaculia bacterium]|nr:hypothetical protein [Thermoanaerobaculia bacterium]